eukprot:TRINITY_DN186_c0_g1_i1.p1 TRINITY_DN186_c0_g1~~TRINITY_DN186_c0_g1_i1.p1  ORF type:complete len:681 (+),score=163.80 TRINITY_DN186_c0_g1_i1:181-2223(+)
MFNKDDIAEGEIVGESIDEAEIKTSEQVAEEAVPKMKEEDKTIDQTEEVVGPEETKEFKAETKKLLEIVARSLYTDREVFIRELISNASDACEKVRYKSISGEEYADPAIPLSIQITTNEKDNTVTIHDTGIGMTKEELIGNIGTIAHSGTQEFMKALQDQNADISNIIGKFGVGFYSVFVVADRVDVYSRSAQPEAKGYLWRSTGEGSYTLAEVEGLNRGTKIVIHLNEESKDFNKAQNLENIIKKYSNFVGFDINVNGEKVNVVRPIWTLSPSEVTPDEHKKFYQFLSHSFDTPQYHLHFASDAPMVIRSVFYVPEQHSEKYGMGRMEPGVNLFSRKVLVQAKIADLLPDWLRFVKGVVDCEDIPLHLSREHLQDTDLIRRLGNVLAGRILRMFRDEARKDKKKYNKFWREFGVFLKEGACTDNKWKEDIAALMRCESSAAADGELISLDEYVERMPAHQKEIYYLSITNRQFATTSPYYEAFEKNGMEVLFFYGNIDDFMMSSLGEYKGKKITSIEAAAVPEMKTDSDPISSPEDIKEKEKKNAAEQTDSNNDFLKWMKESLSDKVSRVNSTQRLASSPVLIVDHESASYRSMMKYVDPSRTPTLPKQKLAVNVNHPIIKNLDKQRDSNPEFATLVAQQLFDDALIAAGLLDDARGMLPRLNKILEAAVSSGLSKKE